jgi:hypothetical protein
MLSTELRCDTKTQKGKEKFVDCSALQSAIELANLSGVFVHVLQAPLTCAHIKAKVIFLVSSRGKGNRSAIKCTLCNCGDLGIVKPMPNGTRFFTAILKMICLESAMT